MQKIPKGYVLIKEEDYKELLATIVFLKAEVASLQQEVKELKQQLHKNSSNSHKPPSSDGYKKPIVKNNREKSNKNQGAQVGHKGSTLKMSDKPDKIEVTRVNTKLRCECGNSLRNSKAMGYNRRQVIDLVQTLTEVTEYRMELRICSCGKVHGEELGGNAPIQYGERIKALSVYLNQYQLIPFGRTQEIFKDWFDIGISDGCIQHSNERCYANLQDHEQQIKQLIKSEAVIHNDETGIRCEGQLQWIHTASSTKYTHYGFHANRGKQAIDDIGILTGYEGISIHDRYSSYDGYECKHGLCNAHLLRDLKYVYEEDGKQWASLMIKALLGAKTQKDESLLDNKSIKHINRIYNKVVNKGFREEPEIKLQKVKKRGRQKKTKSLRLLEVFKQRKDQVLAFVNNALVPFDNNLAERDLRMVKLKQKISGTFRTSKGAHVFCRIRGYISTARKHGYNIMIALERAITGNAINFQQFIPEQ